MAYSGKVESGKAVPNWSKGTMSAGQQPRSETFLAPGTWTWPGNVTHVQVLVVGGGGGGAAQVGPPTVTLGGSSGSGGGGGVRYEFEVPVSAPVPITVGAGGTGGPGTSPNARHGGRGGDSSFGPTIVVGGGGGGWSAHPSSQPTKGSYVPAPPNGGSPGGYKGPNPSYTAPFTVIAGGTYGCRGNWNTLNQAPGAGSTEGMGRYGYGAGGASLPSGGGQIMYWGVSGTEGGSAIANSGAGGNGWTSSGTSPLASGGAGGSGIVIVSWWE